VSDGSAINGAETGRIRIANPCNLNGCSTKSEHVEAIEGGMPSQINEDIDTVTPNKVSDGGSRKTVNISPSMPMMMI
jgi:hypothetical protein